MGLARVGGLPPGLRAGAAGCSLVAVVALVGGPPAGLLVAVACGLAAALAWPVPKAVVEAPAPATAEPARPGPTGPHGPDLATLAGRSWMALETAQAALREAADRLDAQEVAERSQRLAEERTHTIRQLQALAADKHTDAPLLHWLAAPFISRRMLGLPNDVTACVFDLDSVLTTSAVVHAAAWAETFDPFLLERSERCHRPYTPFDREHEYEAYLAGRPRRRP